MSEEPKQRVPLFAIFLGILIGVAGGIYYAWFLNPVSLTNIAPRQLDEESQSAYILLISEAYLQDTNLNRARNRLRTIDNQDPGQVVAEQADLAFARGDDPEAIRALATLAEALGATTSAAEVFSGTVAPTSAVDMTPTATFLPGNLPTDTPRSPSTPVPVEPQVQPTRPLFEADLELVGREVICSDDAPAGLMQVIVLDGLGQGVPGVPVQVAWENGQDVFYTGFKLEGGAGYADYQMSAELAYTVTLIGLAEPVVGINSNECETESQLLSIPTYRLIFAPDASVIETPEEPEDEE